MRLHTFLKRSTYLMAHGVAATLALCGAMPDAMAGELTQTLSSLYVPATALSLTLVSAVMKGQK